MAFNAQLNVKIPSEFTQGLNTFMANVQKFQVRAQQFSQQTGPQQAQQSVQVHLNDFLVKLRRITRFFERMSKVLARIVERIASWLGTMGLAFLRYLSSAIPAFLGSLGVMIPGVGWIFTGLSWAISAGVFVGTTVYYGIKLGLKFTKWLWDKMVDLGDAVLKDWLQAAGAGTTIGGVRALRTTFADMPLTSEALAAAARARFDATSKARRALILLKVKVTKDTADIVLQAIIAARQFMLSRSPETALMQAKDAGLLEIFSPEMLIALTKMSERDVIAKRELFFQTKSQMELTEVAVKWWKDFTIWVQKAGVTIINAIAERLTDPKSDLRQALENLSKAIVKFIQEVLKSPLAEKTIDTIIFYLKAFTEWLQSDAPYKLINDMKTLLKKLNKKFEDINKEGRQLLDELGIKLTEPGKKKEGVSSPDGRGGIRWHRHPGMGGGRQTTRMPSRRPGGPPSAGPLPSTYPEGPPGTRYDPISATSIGGGVGGSSASMGAHRHQGVDLMAPLGSPVYATMDGKIARFGTDNFGQPTVTIRNDDGTYSRYLHMGKRFGNVGDRVRGGQQIGTSGSANGTPHLHYELWYGPPGSRGSRLLDPMKTHGWDRRRALPRGAEPARTNTGTQAPQTPPKPPPPPATTQQQPAPPVQPAPAPQPVPVPRRRQPPAPARSDAPHPSQRQPTPRPRPAPSNAPHPSQQPTQQRPVPQPRPSNQPVTAAPPAVVPTPRAAPAAPAPTARGPIQNSILAEQRRVTINELRDPVIRNRVAWLLAQEDSAAKGNVLESLVNRGVTNRAIGNRSWHMNELATRSFYQPLRGLRGEPVATENMKRDYDRLLDELATGARNNLGGRTDQGSIIQHGRHKGQPAIGLKDDSMIRTRTGEYYGYQDKDQRAMAEKLQRQARSGQISPTVQTPAGPTKWREDQARPWPLRPTRQPMAWPSRRDMPSLRDPAVRGPDETSTRRLKADILGNQTITMRDKRPLDLDVPTSLQNVTTPSRRIANQSDLDFLQSRGGHDTEGLKSVPPGRKFDNIPSTNPEFAARTRAAIEAYERETGKKARIGEMTRDYATQQHYWEKYGHDRGKAAPPGKSRHQFGDAFDSPDPDFLRWLNAGNNKRFGLRSGFLKRDPVHVQMDRGDNRKFYDPNKQVPVKPDPDEPQAAPGDEDIKPGDAGKFLRDHFKKFEQDEELRSIIKEKDPDGSGDPNAGRLDLAQNLTNSINDASPIFTKTDPKLTPQQQRNTDIEDREQSRIFTEGLTHATNQKEFDEYLRRSPKSTRIEDRRDAQYDVGTGYPLKLWTNPGRISSRYDTRTGEKIIQGGSPLRRVYGWEDDKGNLTEEGRARVDELVNPGVRSPYEKGNTSGEGEKQLSAADFLVKQQKELEEQRAAGGRSLEGMTQVAGKYDPTPIEKAEGYEKGEKHLTEVNEGESFVGRPTVYAPGFGGKMEGGHVTSQPALNAPTRAQIQTAHPEEVAKGEKSFDKYYESRFQRPSTLDDVRLGNSTYVTAASDPSNYGKSFTIPEYTYTSVIDGQTYTLRNVHVYVHDTGSKFKGRPDKFDIAHGDYTGKTQADVNKMDKEPMGDEKHREFKKGWQGETTVDDKAIQLAKKGTGGDAARDAQIERDAGRTPDVRHPEARERAPDIRPYQRLKGQTGPERRTPSEAMDKSRKRRTAIENRSDSDVTEDKKDSSTHESDASPSAPPVGNGGGGGQELNI